MVGAPADRMDHGGSDVQPGGRVGDRAIGVEALFGRRRGRRRGSESGRRSARSSPAKTCTLRVRKGIQLCHLRPRRITFNAFEGQLCARLSCAFNMLFKAISIVVNMVHRIKFVSPTRKCVCLCRNITSSMFQMLLGGSKYQTSFSIGFPLHPTTTTVARPR